MQIAQLGYLPPPNIMAPLPPRTHQDPVRASVGHLLSKAHNLPCSTAAQAFTQLVQPTSRFQLALDALLPILESNSASSELAQRILVSYILYSLYAPHPIAINPFKSVLFVTFNKERDQAIRVSSDGATSPNEQLVWVLWKILKGDGNDIGPYSPSTLARSPLPTKLRATNLILDDETYINNGLEADDPYSYNDTYETSRLPSQTDPGEAVDNANTGVAQPLVTPEQDAENESIAYAMKLLLAARGRVLTLSEQRALTPLIPKLTSPSMITSLDLSPLISHNPGLAHPLVVALLTNTNSNIVPELPVFFDVLSHLPPTLPTFDLMGRLLRDPTPTGRTTIADLIRMEVLGRFIHESINWLDHAEMEEREGLISDDRFAKGVQNLCRFYNSLIKLSIADPASDADSAEMAHFSLRNARFEEANALYRVLAMGKF